MAKEPNAYLVIKEPGEKWHFARTREDADHLAHNLLTYVRGCTQVRIRGLGFLSEEVRLPRTYGERNG